MTDVDNKKRFRLSGRIEERFYRGGYWTTPKPNPQDPMRYGDFAPDFGHGGLSFRLVHDKERA